MIVGLTGGIGAGKTLCASIFEELGVPVYNSDDRAKSLMVSDEQLVSQIKELFGEVSYTDKGELNRTYLSKLIFNDKSLLSKMNNIVHPAVGMDAARWAQKELEAVPYVIQESALMFETGSYKYYNKTVLVDAPIEMRIKRVMDRDQSTREDVMNRINKQLPSEDKRVLADYIIENDEQQSLIKQVLDVHIKLLQLSIKST